VTSTMTLWTQLEATPEDRALWLVIADRLDETDWPDLAYCCRWCGSRGLYPLRRQDLSRFPWQWFREGATAVSGEVRRLRRKSAHAVLPGLLYDVTDRTGSRQVKEESGYRRYRSLLAAAESLSRRLRRLRDVVEVRL
jgi:hypothetical protein